MVRIVTVSSSRYEKKRHGVSITDEAGDVAEAEAKKARLLVKGRALVSDDVAMLRREVERFLGSRDDVLLLIGGTGVSSRDITIETLRPYFQKELPGFGEHLRRVSYGDIGTATILTRATAGVAGGKLLVCMPWSPDAVRTALRMSLPEFPHIISIARS